jgi:hypothetical protein
MHGEKKVIIQLRSISPTALPLSCSTRKSGKISSDATVQVLRGKIEIYVGDKTITLKKGQILGITSDIEHSVKAVRNSFYLLTVIGGD